MNLFDPAFISIERKKCQRKHTHKRQKRMQTFSNIFGRKAENLTISPNPTLLHIPFSLSNLTKYEQEAE